MTRLLSSTLVAASLAVSSATAMAADLIAYDGFSYNPTINLHGANGGSGWSGTWVKNQAIPTGVGAPGLSWPNLVTAGNCAVTAAYGNDQYSIYSRVLAPYTDEDGVVYISFLFQPTFGFGEGGGVQIGPLTNGMIVGIHPGTGFYGLTDMAFAGVDTNVPAELDTTALCVVRVTNNFDGTIVYGLYMNPTVGQLEPAFPEATYMIGGTMPAVVRILNDGGFLTDEIRVGKTWASVLPSTLPPACAADLDHSGAVGASDLGLLLGAWGGAAGDLDGNGSTDAADLAVLLGAWGSCS